MISTPWTLRATYFFLCLAGVWAAPVSAQIGAATLGGRVVDPSGEGVADARVFARREGTKVRRSVRADGEGFFLFPPLPAGDWDVEASAKGFTTAVVGDVRIQVAQTRRLDLALEPSDAQEMVSTVDYMPLVRTGSDSASTSVDAWDLVDLPLRTRSVAELGTLEPLVTGSLEIRLGGARVPAAFSPPLSSLREASFVSVSVGAEFSGAAGVVSLVTRSGAARKGSAFVLHRDENLDAAASHSHVGISLGGPLGRQSSRRGTHAFVAAEVVTADEGVTADEIGATLDERDPPDERGLLARLGRHDWRNLLRLRYLRSDPQAVGRLDSLLLGWQTQIADSVVHDGLLQLEDATGPSGFGRRAQLRSDLYVAVSEGPGLHDLALGVESVTTDGPGALAGSDTWSLYARDRWQASDRLRLTGGLRLELVETDRGRSDRLAPRAGLVWRLTKDGSHLLRGGAGRYFDVQSPEAEAVHEVDQLSLGWSWQMSPFLGLSLDALWVDVPSADSPSADFRVAALDREALALTVRSRFGGAFQVRASFSWTDPHSELGDDTEDRAVVTGVYQAPADVLVAAVYRSEPDHSEPNGFDVRVAKGVQLSGDVSLELLAEVFDVFEEQAGGAGRAGQLGLRLSF